MRLLSHGHGSPAHLTTRDVCGSGDVVVQHKKCFQKISLSTVAVSIDNGAAAMLLFATSAKTIVTVASVARAGGCRAGTKASRRWVVQAHEL